jgi:hypothetical protein
MFSSSLFAFDLKEAEQQLRLRHLRWYFTALELSTSQVGSTQLRLILDKQEVLRQEVHTVEYGVEKTRKQRTINDAPFNINAKADFC